MMSLLSYNELCELVEQGVITGVTNEMINSSSIDLTLGREIMVELDIRAEIILKKRDPLLSQKVKMTRYGYRLEPNQFILACTQQTFKLPNNISAEYKLKSSMARIGLNHLTAGWCDSSWHGCLTLELKNVTEYHTITIKEGDPIGQMCFYRHSLVPPEKCYSQRGRYNGDTTVSGVKK